MIIRFYALSLFTLSTIVEITSPYLSSGEHFKLQMLILTVHTRKSVMMDVLEGILAGCLGLDVNCGSRCISRGDVDLFRILYKKNIGSLGRITP